ncbi:hypothetical protein C8A03DRAFT_11405 [Achaetomium macrosporum]|uniref:RNB domain-containing protein n=1 Tax=Achaetomium macrosporum TaxID=79813 RepID=A0AAN7CIC7_9PEZI|nr:hypothetical protein C8A03DRAFT_11405 [Achaetomium macrosporum]
MLRRSSQNYVCWRCLCLRPPAKDALLRRRTPRSAAAAYSALATSRTPLQDTRIVTRFDHRQLRSVSTEQSLPSPPASQFDLDTFTPSESSEAQARKPSFNLPIRERLRKWEAENPTPALAVPRDQPADASVANILTKNRSELNFTLDNSAQDDDTACLHFDGVDMADLGLGGATLQAGDLVEVGSGSWKLRLLSICLGNFNGHMHFYTITGKWFTSRFVRSGFVVKKFIQDPAELQAVIDAIPSLSPDSTVLDELQDLNVGPSRDLAASLIRKMFTFQSASRHIHQTYVERLSRAHTALGNEERLLSLREIADALLPASLKRNKGVFPPEVLYAVYCVIEEQDIAFRALDRGPRHRESYVFMLRSGDTDRNVYWVEQLVRDYYKFISEPPKRWSQSGIIEFNEFLEQARELIDQSRKEREWSPYGMIGPCKGVDRWESSRLRTPRWSGTGRALLKFMQHWVSGGFSPGSRWHWIGPSILRAIGRYQDALLDSTTGWTFLQEIGWIPPWDISARHALRLPGIPLNRHVGFLPTPDPGSPAPTTTSALGADRLTRLRQDFARSTVYCIDSADTLDVDDGISLEPAGNGEYWIHVHIADPASRIAPGSPLAEQAALRVQTNYLAGFYQRMFDSDDVREAFSLGPNKPTLTFSARVTETGRLLDSRVTPGILRDVVYITPEEVASVCDDTLSESVPPHVLEVGTRPANDKPPVKELTTARELSRGQRRELQTLWKLADALQRVRIENGAIPAYLPRAKATVSLDGIAPKTTSDDSALYRGDPYIRVAYDGQGFALVSSLMQLAGEVGARWCYERDIPVPYRVQVVAGENLDALRKFNREVLYPQLAAGKNPSAQDWHTLLSLGGFDISTAPAPNLAMGLELYTKVTSPLRRYPDLLVHWQIEAALLEEERRGQSLAVRKSPGSGSNSNETGPPAKGTTARDSRSWLPFSKKDLEDGIFPRLRVRERHARLLDNIDGNSQWILQALVRAWRFGEGSSQLPKTFHFRVSDVVPRRALKGQIDWFDRPAFVELQHMNDVARIADVKPGDVFKVELADVNVYMNRICVRLLEKVEDEERR